MEGGFQCSDGEAILSIKDLLENMYFLIRECPSGYGLNELAIKGFINKCGLC